MGCSFAGGRVPGARSSDRSEIVRRTKLPRPDGRVCGQVRGDGVGKKQGVHNVLTLGFGSGRTGAGLGRITHIFGGGADIVGLESG